jgi:preprotein translocase subunit YajC
MDFFISKAWADAPAAAVPGAEPQPMMGSVIMLGIFLVLFYFMIVYPQHKKSKEHRKMLGALEKGDELVTNGGILGRVTELDDSFVTLEVAAGVEMRFQRSAVAAVMPKGTYKSK